MKQRDRRTHRMADMWCTICMLIVVGCVAPALHAATNPIDGLGPHVNTEPVMINPLLDDVSAFDENIVETLRKRVRDIDARISQKLSEHDGQRPPRRILKNIEELSEAIIQRDQKWTEFKDAVRRTKVYAEETDVLDTPELPHLSKQARLLRAMNTLEAAECYRELTQRSAIKKEDLQTSATLAQSIDIDTLPLTAQPRLLYLRCAIALDRSRWESMAKRPAFLKEANTAYQLLRVRYPKSLLTSSAGNLLEDEKNTVRTESTDAAAGIADTGATDE